MTETESIIIRHAPVKIASNKRSIHAINSSVIQYGQTEAASSRFCNNEERVPTMNVVLSTASQKRQNKYFQSTNESLYQQDVSLINDSHLVNY